MCWAGARGTIKFLLSLNVFEDTLMVFDEDAELVTYRSQRYPIHPVPHTKVALRLAIDVARTTIEGLARLLLELRLTPRGDDIEPDSKLHFPTRDVDAVPARSLPRRVVSARTPY